MGLDNGYAGNGEPYFFTRCYILHYFKISFNFVCFSKIFMAEVRYHKNVFNGFLFHDDNIGSLETHLIIIDFGHYNRDVDNSFFVLGAVVWRLCVVNFCRCACDY